MPQGMVVMIDEDQHQEEKPREESFNYTPKRELRKECFNTPLRVYISFNRGCFSLYCFIAVLTQVLHNLSKHHCNKSFIVNKSELVPWM
jgi:hypothetical protein